MAMTAFEIFGVLKLDKSDFDNGLNSAQQSVKSFTSLVGGGLATAVKTGAAAVTAAGTAIAGFGATSVSAANQYESAFTGVRKTVDATESEYQELSNWILDASTKMASSQEEIAGTMEIAGQLGISGVEGLQKFTQTMIMLGDTTNLNAEEAASSLAKFGNIAGLAPENMDRIGSVIVDLGNHFATTEADIVAMSSRLASAGTIAGFSATDILALSTAMSSVGINAEAGGTAMSTIMTKIGRAVDNGISPSNDKLALFAQTAGMSAEAFTEAWKSTPTEALQSFVKGLDGVVDAGGNVTAILDKLDISGIRETNTIKSLALASDVLTGAVDMANTAFDENIALQNEAELRYGTTESQMQQMANSFKNLQIAVGEELKPLQGQLMSFGSEAIAAMQQGFEEGGLEGLAGSFGVALANGLTALTQQLPALIDMGMQMIGALGQGLIKNAPRIFNALVQVGNLIFEKASTLIEYLARGITENAPKMIPVAIQLIADFAQYLIEQIPQLVSAGVELISALVQGMGDPSNITTIIDIAINLVMTLLNTLISNGPQMIDAGMNLLANVTKGLMDSLPSLIEKAPEIIAKLLEHFLSNAPKMLAGGIKLIYVLINGIIQATPSILKAFVELIPQLLGAFIRAVPQMITAGIETVKNVIEGISQMIPNFTLMAYQLIAAFISGLVAEYHQLAQSGSEMIEEIKSGILDKIDDAKEWGKDLMRNFISGIKQKISDLRDVVLDAADIVKSYLGFSEPEEGPLSNFHTYAPDMMKLFTQGIADNENMLRRQLENSFDFSDTIINATPTINTETVGVNSGKMNGNIYITVNGAEGQSEERLAEIVSNRLLHEMGMKQAVSYAVT